MSSAALFSPTEEKIYRYDIPAARHSLQRSGGLLAVVFVLFVGPMLCLALLGSGGQITPSTVVPPIIAIVALGVAALYIYHAYYIIQHNVLILSPEGVTDQSPLYKIYTPWSNVERIGPVQVQTGNARADQMLARWDAGSIALILSEPVPLVPTNHGLLGATFGRLAVARAQGMGPRPYILLTYCVGPQPEDDLVQDIQQYAPHLAPYV